MELKINVYNGQTIEKTYTANQYQLMMGTCEDILNAIDVDKFSAGLDSDDALTEIVKIVLKAFPTFKPMMQEIFPELTDDEYRRVPVKDVGRTVLSVVQYTLGELFAVSGKN